MRIQKLQISNILSIEKAELTFSDKGLVLVEGWNYDAGRGNGSGKSAIFNSLSFGLYDKVPRDVTKREILRHGAKNAFVKCEISVGSDVYSVRRTRPSGCEFTKNGAALNITQAEFEEIIGLSFDQFLVTMYTAQDSNQRFLSKNDKGKKDFILEVLKLKDFDKYSKEAKNQIKTLETDNLVKSTELEGLKLNKKTLSGMTVNVDAIRKRIDQNKDDIKIALLEVDKFSKIAPPDLKKYERTEKQILDKSIEFKNIQNEINANQLVLRAKVATIKPFESKSADANCPHCDEGVNISGKMLVKVTDQDLLRRLHNDAIDKTREGIAQIESNVKELTSKLVDLPKIEDLKKKLKMSKLEDQHEYNTALQDIHKHTLIVSSKKLENKRYMTDIQVSKNKEIQLESIVDRLCKVKNEIEVNKREMDMLKLVTGVFCPTGAPAYIMDGIVESFNESAAKYVEMIWSNATYRLQTHKVNSDKKITAKFSEVLLMGGKERSIGSLSGGELKSLSLALDFAIIDVLSKQYSMSINPIILDEPFNGLDSVGKEIVIELLDRLSRDRQIWIIDHAAEAKVMFSDVVRVEKRGGISRIVV